jgi:hypothetical protein
VYTGAPSVFCFVVFRFFSAPLFFCIALFSFFLHRYFFGVFCFSSVLFARSLRGGRFACGASSPPPARPSAPTGALPAGNLPGAPPPARPPPSPHAPVSTKREERKKKKLSACRGEGSVVGPLLAAHALPLLCAASTMLTICTGYA